MKIQTVPAPGAASPKGKETGAGGSGGPGVFTIEITGPFDSSNPTLQAARDIARRTGSAKMLDSLERWIERNENIEKDKEGGP